MDPIAEPRHPLRPFPGLHPHAAHVGLDLAVPIQANASAWAIAEVFGTGHGTRHARVVQDAIPAHLTVEDEALRNSLAGYEDFLDQSSRIQSVAKKTQSGKRRYIRDFEDARTVLKPSKGHGD